MNELTCIVCPVGCHIKIDDEMHVSGNHCPRGEAYAIIEMTSPKRTLTTTVKTIFPSMPRLSVKSKEPVPKELIFEILSDLNEILIKKHVKIGDIIVPDVHQTGIAIIATKTISETNSKGVNL